MEGMNKELLVIAENIIKNKIGDAKKVLIIIIDSKNEPEFVFQEMSADDICAACYSVSGAFRGVEILSSDDILRTKKHY